MRQYKELLQKILDEGTTSDDRTGTGTISLFGEQMQFDLQQGFPLVTIKKTMVRSILHELIWFLRGDTKLESLYILNHVDQVQLIIERECKPLPTFSVDFLNKTIKKDMFDDLLVDDFKVINYKCHPFVKGKISV